MKTRKIAIVAILCFVLGGGIVAIAYSYQGTPVATTGDADGPTTRLANYAGDVDEPALELGDFTSDLKNNDAPLPPFMLKSLDWLAQAQFSNGGYGAGLHSAQQIRDPHAVQVDPATTSLVGLAFIRTGSTHKTGPYSKQVAGVMNYLLGHIEGLPANATQFTTASGTQPQRKLGQNIDATFTSQFLSRMLELVEGDQVLEARVKSGIGVCVRMIESVQQDNGSFQGGSWAGVLQSSMANNALEMADAKGVKVDQGKLKKSREYQRDNWDTSTGSAKTADAAGVALYSISSTSRSTATNARKANVIIERAKEEGKLDPEAEINVRNLKVAGLGDADAEEYAQDYVANEATVRELQKDEVLNGFGNNGGEEFLSHMMTSESMVITGGDAWADWNQKMYGMLSKIQNQDGSWNGHHCITSPVFCTAAVVMTLATDRDVEYIAQVAK